MKTARRDLQRNIALSADFQQACHVLVGYLRSGFPRYNWVGVYMIEGDELVLKAWDGPHPTQHERIPIGSGICGAAASEGETIIVDDVKKDPRYLQCFLQTRSEIVVPIFKNEKVIGEIDIDSDQPGAFGEEDQNFLEDMAKTLAEVWAGKR